MNKSELRSYRNYEQIKLADCVWPAIQCRTARLHVCLLDIP